MEFRKKLVLVLAAVFILATGINAGAQQQVGVFVSPESATSGSGWYGSVEALFLQARINDPIAVRDSDADDDNILALDEELGGFQPIEYAEWGRDGGFRATIGKNAVNSPWDISLEVTYISSGDVKDLADSLSTDATLLYIYLDREPDERQVLNIRSETDLEVIYGDFMARYKVKLGDNFLFGLGGGLRFVLLQDDRLYTATGDDCSGQGLVNNPMDIFGGGCSRSQREDYWGVGPRIQTNVAWAATDRLNIFTNLGFSIQAGERDSRVDEHAVGVNSDIVDFRTVTQRVTSQVVPIVDAQIGIDYHAGNFGLRLGYEFQNWFNIHDGSNFEVSDDDSGTYLDNKSADIGFEGPFLRATLGF